VQCSLSTTFGSAVPFDPSYQLHRAQGCGRTERCLPARTPSKLGIMLTTGRSKESIWQRGEFAKTAVPNLISHARWYGLAGTRPTACVGFVRLGFVSCLDRHLLPLTLRRMPGAARVCELPRRALTFFIPHFISFSQRIASYFSSQQSATARAPGHPHAAVYSYVLSTRTARPWSSLPCRGGGTGA
jgi:hypothetical protein